MESGASYPTMASNVEEALAVQEAPRFHLTTRDLEDILLSSSKNIVLKKEDGTP